MGATERPFPLTTLAIKLGDTIVGYTHYWSFNQNIRGKTKAVNAAYAKATYECAKVVRQYAKEYGGIKGYSAHTEPGLYAGVMFNGSRDSGHEDFVLRERFTENERGNFCKTARKDYDILVTACLSILAQHLPDHVTVDSDGTDRDWAAGVALASAVLRRKVSVPATIRRVKAVVPSDKRVG